MAIQFSLPIGTLVLCDYTAGGFRPPEMIKRRPAIIVSPRLPHRDGLCSVIPISTSFSGRVLPYVVELQLNIELPAPFAATTVWAKCDMIATVGFRRLDMFRTERDHSGQRRYLKPRLSGDQLAAVQHGLRHALGL